MWYQNVEYVANASYRDQKKEIKKTWSGDNLSSKTQALPLYSSIDALIQLAFVPKFWSFAFWSRMIRWIPIGIYDI